MFTQENASKRVALLEKVQKWLDNIPGQSSIPRCSFCFQDTYTVLSIGEIIIWDRENGYADESIFVTKGDSSLTIDLVKRVYKKEIENLALVLKGS